MSAKNIIPFPTRRRDPVYRKRLHRATVRFHCKAVARQDALPLLPETELDARIHAAKATAANYEDLARKAERPVTKVLLEGLARRWAGRIDALLAERDSLHGQADLALPVTGGTRP